VGASFTHLHLHTEFSMLDGAARVQDVVARAAADGQPAVGITDHGNMYGVLDFYKAAREVGVKPIIGTEAYMAGESRFERPTRRGRVDDGGGEGEQGEKLYYHLTLLAENNPGYQNLMKLSSSAYLEGYYYKPRCLLPGQEIVTRHGVTPVEDIKVGDEVLTHRGRFRKVLQTMSRHHSGNVIGLRLNEAYERTTWMTGEHPVLIRSGDGGRRWVEAAAVQAGRPGKKDGVEQWSSWVCVPKVRGEQLAETSVRPADYVTWEPSEHRPGYFVKTAPRRKISRARRKIGPTRHYAQLPTCEAHDDDHYVYKPVADVLTRDYDGLVYNFEVEEDHSYVSDFAIHNCDWELLERHHEGVIATTGCLGGVVLQALLRGNPDRACKLAARLQDIFGRNNLFVELQDHGLASQQATNPQLIEIARKIQAPLLATNDSHYTHREDAVAHDALLCVQTGSAMDDPKRFKFEGNEHYLKSAAEMRSLFSHYPEACDNTLWIAERADVEIEFGKPKLPSFPRPDGFADADSYLRHLTLEGAAQRYGSLLPAKVVERIDYELGVIADMGFPDYFLVVWDLIRYARDRGIRVGPGRGSAAGCCVAYCLRIVDLDPIAHDLIFERFLNPGRKQMPDIDMDFDERYRADMIRYAAERWGWDHVAQIVTFSTIKARAAVRDAARVLGYPYSLGDRVAKSMPPLVMGRDTPLWACFEEHPKHADGYKTAVELRQMYAADPDVARVVDVAKGLEGLRRQDGIHAAAVVISGDALTEYLPIQRKPEAGGRPEDAPIVTQYEMHGVEELGLLKMDFLGLRNLSVIERALDLIEVNTGARPNIDGLPLDDAATYALLQRGETIGVFQLEGGPMRSLVRALAPTEFADVAALVALYRPGPMAANMHNDYADRKNGRKPITYLHPDLAEVLSDTQGLMIFQESMMRVAQRFAGYSLEEADNLRKAAGKKVREIMALEREKFVGGCERTGYGRDLGTKLFDVIEPFADYAFNKSHAYGYGLVSYWTAWLKANHPVEYLAALLTSVKDDKDKTAVYLAECRSMGIEVLVPDINLSRAEFAALREGGAHGRGAIPFGMAAIRNVGVALVERIVAERETAGPFSDFYDFCNRVEPSVLNKRTIESLVKAGGFDSLGHPRQGLCLVSEQIIDRTLARRREQEQGVMSLFGDLGGDDGTPLFDESRVPIPDVEFNKSQRLVFEKEMLGLYVSDHPLMGVEAAMRRLTDVTIAELREATTATAGGPTSGGFGGEGGRGDLRWVGGVVTGLARKYTKRGDLMATFTLEDLQSAIEVWVFPRTMLDVGHLLADDAVVCIKGRIDLRDDTPKLVCMEIKRPTLSANGAEPFHLVLPLQALSDERVDNLKKLLVEHPGDSAVFLHVGSKVLRLTDEFQVDATNGLVAELLVLLGPGCLWN
jgi:DNA polymerase-3 subunit alpha